MPDGTIPDPRQNPKEFRYGIISVNGQLYAYDKEGKKNPKRCMPNGFIVFLDNVDIKNLGQPFNWQGNSITQRVKIKKAEAENSGNSPNQAPIARIIYPNLRALQVNGTWPNYNSELDDIEDAPGGDG